MLTAFTSTHGANFTTSPQFNVPEIGAGVGLIDQQKERMIGEKVYREVQRQMPVAQNPWLEDQLFSVFSHLLSQTQMGQPIGLLIINDPQINAFAVPGGLFALNTGLVTSARNMDEVAGVMAHEIAHVTQRHYSRSQEAFKGQGLLALAGVLVGALVASQADGDAGAAVMMGSQAALMDKQLTYSRNQEREADRIGMQYMYTAGYNPQSMADFFEVMHRATSRVSFLPDFWFTHPLTTERMSEARLRANQLPRVKSSLRDEEFDILKQYTLVVSNQATEQQLQVLASRNNFAAQLALAAFYTRQGDYALAQETLDQAKNHRRLHHLISLIQTDIYLGQNKLSEAYKVISSPARIMPENRALNYKLAEVLIRQNQPAEAQALVQKFLNRNERDLSAWRLMQQAANIDRSSPLRTVNVLRYRAELQYWSGWEEEAIKSLLHAQRLAKDNQAMTAKLKIRTTEMQRERQLKI
ncbi:M48 family metalloprotease [Acinetobacter indicus]|uniref:Putative beta-barrel assembly-enhancing protease n=1 Tax=Acinetobacter indicus TaxID=756892 RepID=A0AAW8Z2P5_9GAMM|nr:M48 family metalloprotease [Acinetobacter indicus]MCO8086934.1 M48 family metalloprotease [Acinetobacter indicus]MCO8099121.1 M48 family metalloprotease [Acinetobacter indicus]MCO8104753.1 M48 family metalloprotease [Acinetobacter indicus]MCO8110427.1 M48 family metalloprotease [Acinetobacter indicus]MDV4315387.1 M48 family metalloprotease [Acinetobacter indicus]